jgi:hypothetical protein
MGELRVTGFSLPAKMTHLIDDKTVAKMGHPVMGSVIRSPIAQPESTSTSPTVHAIKVLQSLTGAVVPRLKDGKVMGVADEDAPEDPQRQETIVGGPAGESFRGVCVCEKGHPGECK